MEEVRLTPSGLFRWAVSIALLWEVSRHAHWSVTVTLVGITLALELQGVVDALIIKSIRMLLGLLQS